MKLYKVKCSDGQKDDFAKMLTVSKKDIPEFKLVKFSKSGLGWTGTFRLEKYGHIYFININMSEDKDYVNPIDYDSNGRYQVEVIEDAKSKSKLFDTYRKALKYTIDIAKKIAKGE